WTPRETNRKCSFDECDLVDLPQCGRAVHYTIDGAFTQEPHALLARRLLDLRRRTLFENHLADAVGQVEQLADCGAPLVPGPAALDAAEPLVEQRGVFDRRIETRFLQERARHERGTPAMRADRADQPLCQHAIQR